jgi:hypothetical protein
MPIKGIVNAYYKVWESLFEGLKGPIGGLEAILEGLEFPIREFGKAD